MFSAWLTSQKNRHAAKGNAPVSRSERNRIIWLAGHRCCFWRWCRFCLRDTHADRIRELSLERDFCRVEFDGLTGPIVGFIPVCVGDQVVVRGVADEPFLFATEANDRLLFAVIAYVLEGDIFNDDSLRTTLQIGMADEPRGKQFGSFHVITFEVRLRGVPD